MGCSESNVSILLCQSTMSEVDDGGMATESKHSYYFCGEGGSFVTNSKLDKIMPDVKIYIK